MELQRGSIFTPDKKVLLIEEIQNELNLVDTSVKRKGRTKELMAIRESLQKSLNNLFDKKGVVTPQETDTILDLISNSKRIRLEGSYLMGMRRTTLYMVSFVAIIVGIYIYNKKRS